MKKILNLILFMALALLAMNANAFTITLDIDNPDAVYVKVDGVDYPNVTTSNLISAESLVEVGVNTDYAFVSFKGDNGGDYLQYDNQTTPVLIRESINLGENEASSNDGVVFTVVTKIEGEGRTIPLTVNVTGAQNVKMKIGPSAYMTSSANRSITLHDGENTIYYSAQDKFAIVGNTDLWTPLSKVEFNGAVVNMDYDYTYLIQLPASGGALTVEAEVTAPPVPVEDNVTFTLNIDDLEPVRFFTKEVSPEEELLYTLHTGSNKVTCMEGTQFSIWVSQLPVSITLDGEPIEKNPGYDVYFFTPTDGCVVDVVFNKPVSPDEEEYVVKVTFVNPDTEQCVYCAQIDDQDVELDDLVAGMKVNAGSEVWISYRRFDYDINDITVNGVTKGPNYTGSVLFNVTCDTEVVFDVAAKEATSVAGIHADTNEQPVLYNLQGVTVNRPQKGLYILNGRKVIVK